MPTELLHVDSKMSLYSLTNYLPSTFSKSMIV
ncbi:rCG59481 [Rattus norvegicus]|uniref:RCG59481 n=1 Tax=Rattus norvegicus TaxID=10116 RepID=A6HQZ0_RAT|nr:rCG59481 [Rattus norvegicus]